MCIFVEKLQKSLALGFALRFPVAFGDYKSFAPRSPPYPLSLLRIPGYATVMYSYSFIFFIISASKTIKKNQKE